MKFKLDRPSWWTVVVIVWVTAALTRAVVLHNLGLPLG